MQTLLRSRTGVVLLSALAVIVIVTSVIVLWPKGTSAGHLTAQDILQNASKTTYRDAKFDLAISSSAAGQTVDGTGAGLITSSPNRTYFTVTLPVTSSGKTTNTQVDTVTDVATTTTYVHSTLDGKAGSWTTQTSDSSGTSTSTDFSSIGNVSTVSAPILVGFDTVGNVNTYHLTGMVSATGTGKETTNGSTSSSATPTASGTATPAAASSKTTIIDMWFSKNTYQPAKFVVKSSIADASASLTLTFNNFDTGDTINLPDTSSQTGSGGTGGGGPTWTPPFVPTATPIGGIPTNTPGGSGGTGGGSPTNTPMPGAATATPTNTPIGGLPLPTLPLPTLTLTPIIPTLIPTALPTLLPAMPDLCVTPTSVPSVSGATFTVQVQNCGTGTLKWSVVLQAPLGILPTASPTNGTLAANATQTVTFKNVNLPGAAVFSGFDNATGLPTPHALRTVSYL